MTLDRRQLLLALIPLWVAPGLLISSSAQASPDFSGSWKLDSAASEPMDPFLELQGLNWAMRKIAEGLDDEQTIIQRSEGLTIRFDNWVGEFEQQLFFDGQAHETQNPAGRLTTFSTTWSEASDTLISRGPCRIADDQIAVLTERRSLSADRNTLTIRLTLEVPDGRSAKVKRVYRRQ